MRLSVTTVIEMGKTAVAGLLAGAVAVMAMNLLPKVVKVEHSITDLRTVAFSDRAQRTSREVAVVGIDETTLSGLAYLSPVDRAYLAELVQKIAATEPRVIVLDIIFDRPTEPTKDTQLAATLRDLPVPVVLTRVTSQEALDAGFQDVFLRTANRPTADALVSATVDDVVRHLPVAPNGQCSLAEAAQRTLQNPGVRTTPACSRTQPIRIDWLLEPPGEQTFTYFLAGSVTAIDPIAQQLARLRGKVVIVGGVYGQLDRHKTPLSVLDGGGRSSPSHGQIGGNTTPGVMIHAQALQQLLDGRVRGELNSVGEATVLGLSAIFGSALASRRSFRDRRGIVLTIVSFCLILIDVLLFKGLRFVLPGDAIAFAIFLGIVFNSVRLSHRAGGIMEAGKTVGGAIL